MTLRRQILLFGLGISFALSALLIAGLFMLKTIAVPAIQADVERKTAMSLQTLVAMDVELATDDIAALKAMSKQLSSDKDLSYIRIQTNDGEILFQHGERPEIGVEQDQHAISQIGNVSFGAGAVIFEGLPLGRVEIAYSASDIEAMRFWIRIFTAITIGFVLMSIVVSIRFSKSIVDPIVTMMDFTKEVKDGCFPGSLPEEMGASEVRRLATHLNSMATTLEQRNRLLADQREHLESNLKTIHKTREQLLSSTRLAAVGEMAGRTAHEVLNPVASIHGRLTRLSEGCAGGRKEDIILLTEVIDCWRDDFQRGGFVELIRGFEQNCASESGECLFEEDIGNFTIFLSRQKKEQEEMQADLKFLLREVNRIIHIIDGMRGLARSRGSRERHKVREMLLESLSVLQDGFKKRRIEPVLSCDPSVAVYADCYEFIQVITNLMRNSMLAIEEDRGRVGGSVTLDVEVISGQVQIRIADDGPGINSEHKSLIFESSFTTRSSSDGTGLGLAIARRLVRGFEGDLTLESSTSEGTTFLIEMPDADALCTWTLRDSGEDHEYIQHRQRY